MIELFDKAECPYCYRVRLCLGHLAVPYERYDHRDPAAEARWRPLTFANTVPVLVEGDVVLTDSSTILEYLQETRGGLLPDAPHERARVRELVRYADVVIGRAIREVIFEKRDKPRAEWDRERIDAGTEAYLAALPYLDAALGDETYFGGTFSVADAALTTRMALGLAYGVDVPERSVPRLARYFDARRADGFFESASPPRVREVSAPAQPE